MKSIISYSNLWDSDPILNVDFGDGSAFTLNYEGRYESFLKEFIPNLKDFFNGVIEEYGELTAQRNDYEDCFNTMIADFETVDFPYFKRIDKRYRECLAEWYAETTLIDYPDRFRKEGKNV